MRKLKKLEWKTWDENMRLFGMPERKWTIPETKMSIKSSVQREYQDTDDRSEWEVFILEWNWVDERANTGREIAAEEISACWRNSLGRKCYIGAQ